MAALHASRCLWSCFMCLIVFICFTGQTSAFYYSSKALHDLKYSSASSVPPVLDPDVDVAVSRLDSAAPIKMCCVGNRLLRIKYDPCKMCSTNACERAVNRGRLRETRSGAQTVLYGLDYEFI